MPKNSRRNRERQAAHGGKGNAPQGAKPLSKYAKKRLERHAETTGQTRSKR